MGMEFLEMAYPKQDPETKVRAICGTSTRGIINLVRYEAAQRKITVAALVGEILEKWVEGREIPEGAEWEYLRYRHWQRPKRVRPEGSTREGPLGKILGPKSHHKKVDEGVYKDSFGTTIAKEK
jgi:hypothetical protein